MHTCVNFSDHSCMIHYQLPVGHRPENKFDHRKFSSSFTDKVNIWRTISISIVHFERSNHYPGRNQPLYKTECKTHQGFIWCRRNAIKEHPNWEKFHCRTTHWYLYLRRIVSTTTFKTDFNPFDRSIEQVCDSLWNGVTRQTLPR